MLDGGVIFAQLDMPMASFAFRTVKEKVQVVPLCVTAGTTHELPPIHQRMIAGTQPLIAAQTVRG